VLLGISRKREEAAVSTVPGSATDVLVVSSFRVATIMSNEVHRLAEGNFLRLILTGPQLSSVTLFKV
jgi:hypothetical protein